MILKFIFWIIIIVWLWTKLKNLFSDEEITDRTFHRNNNYTTDDHTRDAATDKTLKNNAGDYIDYEEIK